MSRNTHEPNASPAHSSHQADYISDYISGYPTRFCCTCRDRVTCLVGWAICPNCGHKFCEMCSDVDSGSENQALNLYNTPHRVSDEVGHVLVEPRYIPNLIPTSPPPPPLRPHRPLPHPPLRPLPPATISDPNQPQGLNSHGERDPPEEAQNELNKKQEHEMRPQTENTEKQQSLPTPGRKKRKLNTEKCQRCREDKKGCTWKSSEKCDRCTEKGLSCSERTRVTRPRKHASKPVSPVPDAISPSVDSSEFEDRFKKWAFLKSYHKMMTMAMDRLKKLEQSTESRFDGFVSQDWKKATALNKFKTFVDQVYAALHQALGEIVNTEHGLEALLAHSSTRNLNLALGFDSLDMMCVECCPASLKSTTNKVIESLDVCGAFLAQQPFFSKHGYLFNPYKNDDTEDLKGKEIERYNMFSTKIPQQAEAILESLGFSDAATYSRSLGLYHFDFVWKREIKWDLKFTDCLGRTPLHRFLDQVADMPRSCLFHYKKGLFDNDIIEMSWWNRQDIIGRTPLHIAFQFWNVNYCLDKVETILEKGTNPSLATICGHTSLHYAAANGHVGICKLLMEYMSKSDIGARDGRGRTALGYSIIKNRPKVVDLLMDYYKEAGFNQEIEDALEIKKAIEDGFRFD